MDRPEDLELWRGLAKPLLSVVIPVLNESASLPATLAALGLERFGGTVEVIVVDGGSHDDSAALAAAAGCRVLVCRPSGRGRQMNLGAAAARGRYLLFLHADTRIPDNAFIKICRSLARPGVALGAFSLALDEPGVRFRLLEKLVHWRSRFWGLPYGDQGFFVRAETFAGVGGFWSEGLLEDVDFLRRIKPTGRLVLLPEKILTSARRWRRNGFWRVTLVNQMILLGYWLGVPPHVLFRFYYGGVSGGD
ncbi:MAG TPA: glycosyltransferase [Proteobacteria bacterium]|nr:glycosyltransferase [Pseudomonadota bacterium]